LQENNPQPCNHLPLQTYRLAVFALLFLGLVSMGGSTLGETPAKPTGAADESPASPAPVLMQDAMPATAFNMVGDQVTFTAVFSDSPATTFQWQKITDGATNDVSGATNMTLTLANLQLTDAAAYRLEAINTTNRLAVTYTSARPLRVERVPAAANNIVTITASQTGLSDGAFTPTWTVVTNDNLIAAQAPVSNGGDFSKEVSGRNIDSLTAGGSLQITKTAMTVGDSQGGFSTSDNYVTCGDGYRAGSSFTYLLTGSKNGYNLTSFTTYGGWVNAGRDQQAYTVYYSTIAAPELFIPLASVNFTPPDPADAPSATRVTLRPAAGVLAKNVALVKFDFTNPSSKNGYCGYSQIILSGAASATLPPPNFQAAHRLLTGTNNSPALNRLAMLGPWIWDAKTFDGQTCLFWRTFDIPADGKVVNARLVMTTDNEFTLFIDGHEVGHGAEWQELFDYNLLPLRLTPSRHVLAIKAFNYARLAGVTMGLHIDLADGRFIEIKSDKEWKIVPTETKGWEKTLKANASWPAATIVAPIGTSPWWNEPAYVNVLQTHPPTKIFFWQTTWFQIIFLTLSGILLLTIFALAAQLALHQKERWLVQRERARIAMDVHDDIGSRITQLVLSGEDVQEALPEDSAARKQLTELWDDAREVLSSIDEILWALNPRLDTLRDFANYICDYAHKFLGPAGIECVFEVDPKMQLTAADLPLRRSLLMAIKETLRNSVKHSGATELRLKIERQRQILFVVVEDNGSGFDPAAIPPGRNGLGNLSRRMHELGGSCHIFSQPGKGCRTEFRVPLKRPRRFSWFRK